MFNSSRSFYYANIIELAYDMKPHVIEEAIIMPYLNEYLVYSEKCSQTDLPKSICDGLYQRIYIKAGISHDEYRDKERFTKFVESNISNIENEIGNGIPRIRKQMIQSSLDSTHYLMAERASRWILDFIGRKYKGLFTEEDRSAVGNDSGDVLLGDVIVSHESALAGKHECIQGIKNISSSLFNDYDDNEPLIGPFEISNQRVQEVISAIKVKIDSMNEQEEF